MAKKTTNLTIRIDQKTLGILDRLRSQERIRSSRAEYIRMLIRYAKPVSDDGGRFIVGVPQVES